MVPINESLREMGTLGEGHPCSQLSLPVFHLKLIVTNIWKQQTSEHRICSLWSLWWGLLVLFKFGGKCLWPDVLEKTMLLSALLTLPP